MRKIIEVLIVVIAFSITWVACSNSVSSKIDEEINRKILRRIASLEEEKHFKIISGNEKLEFVRKEMKTWMGRNVHRRAGFFPTKIKMNNGEIKKVDIAFVASYGEENGEIVTGECLILAILSRTRPGYEETKKEIIQDMKSPKLWS
jgi:hypothetical protein